MHLARLLCTVNLFCAFLQFERYRFCRLFQSPFPFISYPPATQVISQDKLVNVSCHMTSTWMHAHF